MSKKDYIKFAALLKKHRPLDASFVDEIADILKEDNPKFDRDRFYKAIYKD